MLIEIWKASSAYEPVGEVDRLGQSHVRRILVQRAGVAAALHRGERVNRSCHIVQRACAVELRELADRQHVAGRLEVTRLVQRVVALDDRTTELGGVPRQRVGDAAHTERIRGVGAGERTEVVLPEVIGQEQAVLEESRGTSATTHSAVGSPLSP